MQFQSDIVICQYDKIDGQLNSLCISNNNLKFGGYSISDIWHIKHPSNILLQNNIIVINGLRGMKIFHPGDKFLSPKIFVCMILERMDLVKIFVCMILERMDLVRSCSKTCIYISISLYIVDIRWNMYCRTLYKCSRCYKYEIKYGSIVKWE